MQIKQNRRQDTEPRYKLSNQWEEKALKYPKRAKEADVGRNKTNQWLRSTGLKKNLEKKNSKDAAVSFLVISFCDGTAPRQHVRNTLLALSTHTTSVVFMSSCFDLLPNVELCG